MTTGTTMLKAQIEAAEAYEKLFVPALFGEWASRTVTAARVRPGERVLDVACGTGGVAREASSLVGDGGSVSGLDANAGMVEVARRLASPIDWRQGAAESLPFPDRTFDVVLCQFGLMFFTDRTLALRQMMRVLVPAGRLAVVVWDEIERAPVFATLASLLERMVDRRAADALHAPFVLGNRSRLLETFAAAHVAPVTVATHPGKAKFPSIGSLVEAELRGWLPVMGIELSEDQVRSLLAEAETALRPFVGPGGELIFDMSAHIATVVAAGRAITEQRGAAATRAPQ